jgi:hypothetical protein
VKLADIRVRPTGEIYLPHIEYTRWFNRAFGRGGWQLRPITKAWTTDKGTSQYYRLFIHGNAAATAPGDGEQAEDRGTGDTIEAGAASALRRCAKRLGVSLELWDRRFADRFLAEHCVLVRLEKGRAWRRVDDKAFPDEVGPATEADRTAEAKRHSRGSRKFPPRSSTGHRMNKPITALQLRRMWTIATNAGRTHDEVSKWLKGRYGLTSTKDLPQEYYEAVCKSIESRGDLPAREAGEEG